MKTKLCLPSDLKYLPVVEKWLLESLKSELNDPEICQNQCSRLRLVLAEAYSNVVIHAHNRQSEIPICLELELKEHELILEIWDCGEGFDVAQYCPPQPQVLQEGGYGWFIINQLMDEVEYSLQVNGCNRLKMQTNF